MVLINNMASFQTVLGTQYLVGVKVNVDKYVHLKKRYVPPYVHLDVSVQMDYS